MNRYITALDRNQQVLLGKWLDDSGPGEYDINEGQMVFARGFDGVVTVWVYQQPQEA